MPAFSDFSLLLITSLKESLTTVPLCSLGLHLNLTISIKGAFDLLTQLSRGSYKLILNGHETAFCAHVIFVFPQRKKKSMFHKRFPFFFSLDCLSSYKGDVNVCRQAWNKHLCYPTQQNISSRPSEEFKVLLLTMTPYNDFQERASKRGADAYQGITLCNLVVCE